MQGRIQDFKLGGAHLKKLRRAEGGAKIFGVFRVKNHDFTSKNHIFSNCGGRHEHFWGISCEKSRFYAKNSYFFPILGGARAGCPPPESAPGMLNLWVSERMSEWMLFNANSTIVQLYYGENKLIFNRMILRYGLF